MTPSVTLRRAREVDDAISDYDSWAWRLIPTYARRVGI